MDILLIAVTLIVGLILLVAEVYLFPGITLAGICATGCLIFANVYAYIYLGGQACLITFILTLIGSASILLWVFRSKSLDKTALKKEIDSTLYNKALDDIHPGDKGITMTRLALIGNAQINGHIIEVKSLSGLIDENTEIIVERIDEGIILVSPINK